MKWIVVDLDGTIADCSHRVHLAHAQQWDEFHSLCTEDKLIEANAELVSVLGQTYGILMVTGRTEKFRWLTHQWLQKMGLGPFVTVLLMRPDDDFRPDVEMKLALLEGLFGSKENVLAQVLVAFDDRDKVVAGFRDYGIPTFQVRQGDY